MKMITKITKLSITQPKKVKSNNPNASTQADIKKI